MERCIYGETQNANEALYQVIRTKCSKTIFVSKDTLETAVGMAICEYNTGKLKSITDMQTTCGNSPGNFTVELARELDKKRQTRWKRKASKHNEYRRKKQYDMLKEEERRLEKEGPTYGPGEF